MDIHRGIDVGFLRKPAYTSSAAYGCSADGQTARPFGPAIQALNLSGLHSVPCFPFVLWCTDVRYGPADVRGFRILWGFVLCVEEIFGVCLGVCSCPLVEAAVMMTKIRPGQ